MRFALAIFLLISCSDDDECLVVMGADDRLRFVDCDHRAAAEMGEAKARARRANRTADEVIRRLHELPTDTE